MADDKWTTTQRDNLVNVDVVECSRCRGSMRPIACIEEAGLLSRAIGATSTVLGQNSPFLLERFAEKPCGPSSPLALARSTTMAHA